MINGYLAVCFVSALTTLISPPPVDAPPRNRSKPASLLQQLDALPSVSLEAPAAPEDEADDKAEKTARVGEFDRTFDERSPLSSISKQVSRDTFNGRVVPVDYAAAGAAYRLFVPEAVKLKKPMGLLVWIDPSPNGRIPHVEELAKLGLIGVSPYEAGNGATPWVRAGRALDAVHNMTKQYSIDPDRIYVAGFSGGGRMASRLGLMYADVFAGSIPIDGTDWWEDVPASKSSGKWFRGRFQKPSGKILSKAKKSNRYYLITGEHDGNRPGTIAAFKHGYKRNKFKHAKCVVIPGKAHAVPEANVFRAALQYIDHRKKR